jgi:hypothetical protein
MSLGRSKGGLPPDAVCEEEPAALEDMERLITEFHDNSRCGPRASAHDLERVMSSCSSQR